MRNIDTDLLKEMVLNSIGVSPGTVVRVFMGQRSFVAAVNNSSGKMLFYGQVDVSSPGMSTFEYRLAFFLRDELVRLSSLDAAGKIDYESDMPILFDRVAWVGVNLQADIVFASIADVDFQPADAMNLYSFTGVGGIDYYANGTGIFPPLEALGMINPTTENVLATDKLLLFKTINVDNPTVPGFVLIRNYDYSVVRWGSVNPAAPIDVSLIMAAGGTLHIYTLGGFSKLMPVSYKSVDNVFAGMPEDVFLVQGGFNFYKPATVGFTENATYNVKTNQLSGTVRVRTKRIDTDAYTAHHDTTIALASGVVLLIPNSTTMAEHVIPLKYELDYTPPATAAVANILVKNQDAAKTFYWLHNGVSGNILPGATATIAITAGVGFFTKYVTPPVVGGGDSSARKKWLGTTLVQSYFTTGTETFYDFVGFDRLSYSKDGTFTTW